MISDTVSNAMGGATLSLKGTETILVAEDEDGVRSLTREVLEKYGYRVLEAANGEEALDRRRPASRARWTCC